MDEGVSVSDENGIILFTNPSEDAMFGYGEGELVGKHVTTQNSYPPEENAKIVSTVISELNKKGFWSGEWHNLKKDGSAFYTHSFITSLDTDGKKLFVCVQRDITAEKKAQELLAYRTAILEAQNDAIPDGILIVDTKGKILSFNKHFIELWKIPGDIIEGKDDTLALEYAKEQLSNPNAFLENLHYSYTDPEKKSPEEFWLKDGRIIEGYGNPVIGENGYNYGWAWYFRNITERKKAEQELKLTKEQLELTFRNVPAGISLFDNSGKILFANDNAARLVGYSSAEEMMAEKDVSQLRQRADEKNVMLNEKGGAFLMEQSPTLIALTTGKAAEAIIQILSRNGQSSTWVLSKATAIFDEHRRVCMVLTASTDITAQKVSEQKIRQSEEQLRTLSEQLEMKVKERTEELDVLNKTLLIQNETFKQAEESSKQGSYSFNLATGTLIYSDNLYRLLGYKVGEFSPSLEEFNKHVHPDDQEYVTKSAEKVLQTISADDWKYRMIKKDGGLIHIRATGRIISLNNENLLVGTLQDITADVLLKQTLQEKNLELERSNEDLQQFAHVASHDLKEPLRKIKTFGSLLTSEVGSDLSTKANTYLKKMENAADRMFNMIDGVLLYSSLNDGHLLDERVNLYELLRGITVDLEVLIDQKRATLLHTDLPTIRGSKILLNQLFYNLVYNALKFSKADRNPEITIHSQYVSGGGLEGWVTNTSSRKDYVQIEIQDNGIGFENSDAERIFKTFTRLNSKDLYEGTGLGLALCKKIVERHQGIIYAQGRPGEGATFYVILPK
jgi:PAS domain S-box-containing protein